MNHDGALASDHSKGLLTAHIVSALTRATGSVTAIAAAFLIVFVWAATGPLAGYSDTWQLIINTGTTVVTFLMVFIIQNSQNRDMRALQAKMDEMLECLDGTHHELVGIEDGSERVTKAEQVRQRKRA